MEDIEQSSLTVDMPDSDSRSSRSLVNSSSSLHSLSGIASYGLIKQNFEIINAKFVFLKLKIYYFK